MLNNVSGLVVLFVTLNLIKACLLYLLQEEILALSRPPVVVAGAETMRDFNQNSPRSSKSSLTFALRMAVFKRYLHFGEALKRALLSF